MVYSDTTNKSGVIQNIESMCDLGDTYISGNTANQRYFNGIINRVQHRIWHIIHKKTGNWSYDSGSYTDLPVATTNLVSGTTAYALPETALTVKRIEAKDASGQWTVLEPITEEKIPEAIGEFMDTSSQPSYYTLKDGVINLYPASNYASTDGLKIYYDRGAVEFVYNATTATPGFASPYHEILPLGASIEWYKIKQPQSLTLAVYIQDYAKLEKSIEEHYSSRFKDYKPKIGRAYSSYK